MVMDGATGGRSKWGRSNWVAEQLGMEQLGTEQLGNEQLGTEQMGTEQLGTEQLGTRRRETPTGSHCVTKGSFLISTKSVGGSAYKVHIHSRF